MKALAQVSVCLLTICLQSQAARGAEEKAAKPKTLEITNAEFEKEAKQERKIELAADEKLVLTLASNPTTGFTWPEKPKLSQPKVLKQLEHKHHKPEKQVPGAGGKQVWTFQTIAAGTATVDLDYSRPWQGGEKAVRSLKLTVTVK